MDCRFYPKYLRAAGNLALLALGAIVAWAAVACSPACSGDHRAGQTSAYLYHDDSGNPVYVDDRAKVPPRHRASSRPVFGDPGARDSIPPIYRYRGASGNPAYTNDLLRVPSDRRKQAEIVDLSQISLNHELANELASEGDLARNQIAQRPRSDLVQAIDMTYELALDSRLCRDARDAADASWLAAAWHHHVELVLLGGALLVLLLATPFAIRRIDAAVWAKVLMTAILAFSFVGLTSYLVGETRDQLGLLDVTAAPCRHDGAPSASDSPDTARSRLTAIELLRRRVAERNTALDQAMRVQ